ncbi:hypothetical protein [Halodesulfovibrio sp.]|jgi:drug/metabolite transporter (DMT)-like permease|uniref:hypothetical protein n=1 Tax=Halodesulfovibrio sp. TaxID=1912772 RepID=UPI0025F57E4B|nr:hypothetical protein [Halodesulfovibrio sp.]MCT4535109.1 hypothetical protein [Halodesulfovibrio sp.]MCT4627407.1 hypothetical protein [Halodesulfovibrio sp.]
MSQVVLGREAIIAKKKLDASFRTKGICIALLSAVVYGLYTAFLTLGMSKGVWADWYGANTAGLTAFVITYFLGAVGSALNDSFSAVWALSLAATRGRLGDFFRCLKTKPGLVMVTAALIGGPIATTAYVVGLQLAGSIVVPIAALCPAIGAILGRVLFKQELNARMMLGIAICFLASFMIASTSLGGEAPDGQFLGICIAFIAALGWGFEGCVCGYGTSMIDSEIAITIRQTTSALSTLFIFIPVMAVMSGSFDSLHLVTEALFCSDSIIWFAVSGLCAYLTFMFWYQGNGMCGAALGMSCNGTFSFWGPFGCWIILGIIFGIDGWSMPPIAWAAAVLMIVGIFTVAMNPLELFKKKEEV